MTFIQQHRSRNGETMSAFALAHLKNPNSHPDVLEYMERVDETLVPFGGWFVVHGAEPDVREGQWPGTIVIIGFPSLQAARDWYDSPAYQAILPLRTGHIDSTAILVDGVAPTHQAADMAAIMRAAAQA
ncbi:DUF1330 domain-containing protein [Nonomuraea sp. NPDC050310]|uniref:DUF1330 domain-containing protein n=1 Tax=Nonomuraea sp. NPDC050310 TaxID=3154935 RepID=UPI0033F7039F